MHSQTLPAYSDGGFIERLRNAGIEPGDSEQERLNKTLLFLATGLITLATILWLVIYWVLGPKLPATLPFLYQVLLSGNLLLYVQTRDFRFFRTTQLGLFLFMPFVMQWMMGNFINSSGVVLWALLAPFGAMLCLSVRESAPWFLAWMILMLFSGISDFFLVGEPGVSHTIVPARTTVTFFMLNFIAVGSIMFALLRYSTLERERFRTRIELQHALVQKEHARSEALLLNVLPAPIAARLKGEDEIIADGFPDVTVMFADISHFTEMAAGLAPTEVFATLNRIFSAFDELAEKHGLEKIKTIGDAYMVAGGLNFGTKRHAEAMAALALDMQRVMKHDPSVNTAGLKLHVGISCGPVVAGVIGKKKFIYDLWGNTVNVSSRITEITPAGGIWCDAATRDRLGNACVTDSEHVVDLKGCGKVTLYSISAPQV